MKSIIIAISLLTLLFSCDKMAPQKKVQPADKVEQKTSIIENKPEIKSIQKTIVIHGSSTVGSKLIPDLAKDYLIQKGAADIYEDHQKDRGRRILTGQYGDTILRFEIEDKGSSTGFEGLRWKSCDIGMSSRPIKQKEIDKLSFLGDMTSGDNEFVIALDCIAIVVNKKNKVPPLTLPIVKQIFEGTIKDWSEISSNMKGPINCYVRDEHSGTFDTFKNLVMYKKPTKKNCVVSFGHPDLSEKVSNDSLGIGYVGLPYIKDNIAIPMAAEKNLQQFKPTKFNVMTEDYPIVRPLFLYLPTEGRNKDAEEFIHYILSFEGQKAVEKSGVVAQLPKLTKPHYRKNSATAYVDETKDYMRVSMNFRFRYGGESLNNTGVRNIDRLINFIHSQELESCSLKLIGFTDSLGNQQANQNLSIQRADVLKNLLAQKDKNIGSVNTVGLGSLEPVASNKTSTGRMRNRRVEVWLKCN